MTMIRTDGLAGGNSLSSAALSSTGVSTGDGDRTGGFSGCGAEKSEG